MLWVPSALRAPAHLSSGVGLLWLLCWRIGSAGNKKRLNRLRYLASRPSNNDGYFALGAFDVSLPCLGKFSLRSRKLFWTLRLKLESGPRLMLGVGG